MRGKQKVVGCGCGVRSVTGQAEQPGSWGQPLCQPPHLRTAPTSAVQQREVTPMKSRMGPCGHSAWKLVSLPPLPLCCCWAGLLPPPLPLLLLAAKPAAGSGSAAQHGQAVEMVCEHV